MRFVGLVFALAVGSALASLARELPDPVWSAARAFERSRSHSFEMRGPTLWFVAPTQPSPDSVWINGVGYVEPGRSC